jgi:hypothetical protein
MVASDRAATGGAHVYRPGLVVTIARAHDARSTARPADCAGARRKAAGPGPGPAAAGSGDAMNVSAASDLEAADLLALARLDDDGALP